MTLQSGVQLRPSLGEFLDVVFGRFFERQLEQRSFFLCERRLWLLGLSERQLERIFAARC